MGLINFLASSYITKKNVVNLTLMLSDLGCIETMMVHGIEVICLPPHTTHILQPLDVAIGFNKIVLFRGNRFVHAY